MADLVVRSAFDEKAIVVALSAKVMTTHETCSTQSLSTMDKGVCIRNVLWVLLPLYL